MSNPGLDFRSFGLCRCAGAWELWMNLCFLLWPWLHSHINIFLTGSHVGLDDLLFMTLCTFVLLSLCVEKVCRFSLPNISLLILRSVLLKVLFGIMYSKHVFCRGKKEDYTINKPKCFCLDKAWSTEAIKSDSGWTLRNWHGGGSSDSVF